MAQKLKPVNGVLVCPRCAYHPELNSFIGAKAGEACQMCHQWPDHQSNKYDGKVGKYTLDLTTQLGPTHEVESTGNPLFDAAAILSVDGWVAGSWVCESGKKCLDGALRAACGVFVEDGHESTLWGEKYVNAAYKKRLRKLAKVRVTLAEAIRDEVQGSRAQALVAFRVTHDVLLSSEEFTEEQAVSIITEYNDRAIKDTGRRKAAIAVCKKAATNWNPRRKAVIARW